MLDGGKFAWVWAFGWIVLCLGVGFGTGVYGAVWG